VESPDWGGFEGGFRSSHQGGGEPERLAHGKCHRKMILSRVNQPLEMLKETKIFERGDGEVRDDVLVVTFQSFRQG
jgi:hypothetical protein